MYKKIAINGYSRIFFKKIDLFIVTRRRINQKTFGHQSSSRLNSFLLIIDKFNYRSNANLQFFILKLTDMKKLYILSALILLITESFAQWPARYNPANKVEQARVVVIDANNNVYVTGRSQDKKGNDDYATIKYSPSGQQLWVARYNGTGNGYDIPHGLTVDAEGNVYVTGGSLGSGTGYDYATVKYNSAGAQQWVARYD